MSKPTADSSPGDEMDAIIADLADKCADLGAESMENGGFDDSEFTKAVHKAKDRLNRLMLTETKRKLETLANVEINAGQDDEFADGYAAGFKAMREDIDDAIAAIDAQLNKEEK